MWRQKNSTVFAVLLIAITLNFIVTPTYAKNTELEGENYAPSSSSFQKPANVHAKNDTVTVGYFLGGGIQNSFNKESYPAFSGDQPLSYAIPEWIPVSRWVLRCRSFTNR